MQTLIQQLNWCYATKQYDSTKKISDADIATLKEAVRLAPSAYGLQPYKVFVVESQELRQQLREKSYGQPQVTDASHFFVFAAQKAVDASHIDSYIDLIAETRGIDASMLEGFANMMKGSTGGMSTEQATTWSARQAYIGLGTLVTAAATLNIDASPMEGFDPAGYREVLGLTDHEAVVICALGYRSEEDATQHHVKVRKPEANFFETL